MSCQGLQRVHGRWDYEHHCICISSADKPLLVLKHLLGARNIDAECTAVKCLAKDLYAKGLLALYF